MKPREFDDLVKQKFEEGDFEYKPQNWERLAEELDGRGRKRGLLFWWMPLVGIAASVTLAFGITTAIREGSTSNRAAGAQYAAATTIEATTEKVNTNDTKVEHALIAQIGTQQPTTRKHTAEEDATDKSGGAAINLEKSIAYQATVTRQEIISTFNTEKEVEKKKKKVVAVNQVIHTFKEAPLAAKAPKVAISLAGGLNYGSQISGYTIGATARKMLNDKVYVEGDIAFIGTSNTQKTEYLDKSQTGGSVASGISSSSSVFAGKGAVTARTTSPDAEKNTEKLDQGVIRTANQNYNLYYAQVTPSIGYKLMKRLTVGVGPDFQQMLVDNRPAASTVDRGNIKEVPTFDVGFMGKTEYAVSRNVKAALYYREGVNNIITPMNKFIDRNYVQVQVKCSIFNR